MAINDLRRLAHRMIDKLEDEQLADAVASIKKLQQKQDKNSHPVDDPDQKELDLIHEARKEYGKGNFCTHDDVFGEDKDV
ncbi:hypothetical protein [Alteribacter natronophilus]|uniref:hypothetical protein n=1 Tax=Alteribacter natronophilus TaxID=2583810 RepID=UPI00110F2C93|nr:hypothetical protein [Alteribacter natronophilus]TMW70986.1 hypothetical protein FGB90_13510 [Alteribacter natronophilus]